MAKRKTQSEGGLPRKTSPFGRLPPLEHAFRPSNTWALERIVPARECSKTKRKGTALFVPSFEPTHSWIAIQQAQWSPTRNHAARPRRRDPWGRRRGVWRDGIILSQLTRVNTRTCVHNSTRARLDTGRRTAQRAATAPLLPCYNSPHRR